MTFHNEDVPGIIRNTLNARAPVSLRNSQGENRRHAAVLMPLSLDQGEYRLIFTKRTGSVASHKGQISFPGGVVDEKDAGFQETAMREADEEIGLSKEDVTILGRTDDIKTKSSNFIVHTFVGLIPGAYGFSINPDEVEKIIQVPLWVFFSEDPLYRKEKAEFQGVVYQGAAWQYNDDLIWGATARILVNFIAIMGDRLTSAV
jgi:8-oxo-dGTP pyrophosphatase MutT (NUDIX family)